MQVPRSLQVLLALCLNVRAAQLEAGDTLLARQFGGDCGELQTQCGSQCILSPEQQCCLDDSVCDGGTFCYTTGPGTYGCCPAGESCGNNGQDTPPSNSAAPSGACASYNAIFSACESATPAFSSYSQDKQLASCFCYQQSTWAPDIFDGVASSCALTLSMSSDSQALSTFSSYPGLCTRVGDIMSSPATASASTTSGSATPTSSAPSATGSQSTASQTMASSTPSSSSSSSVAAGAATSSAAANAGALPVGILGLGWSWIALGLI